MECVDGLLDRPDSGLVEESTFCKIWGLPCLGCRGVLVDVLVRDVVEKDVGGGLELIERRM